MRIRGLVLVSVVAAALLAVFWARSRAGGDPGPIRLTHVTTAHQLGVVGYRDPVGAISGDGLRIAFAEGRRLFEQPTTGGVRREIAMAEGQIRYLAPLGATPEWIFEDAATSPRWWAASSASGKRPLFGTRAEIGVPGSAAASLPVDALRQVVVSADGQHMAAAGRAPFGRRALARQDRWFGR